MTLKKSFYHADLVLKKHLLLWYSAVQVMHFVRILWWIEYSKVQIFSDIINVFTLTFDQFNESLFNKGINKIVMGLIPKFWTVVFIFHKAI